VQPDAVTSRLKAADNAYRRVESASSTGRRDEIRANKAAVSPPIDRCGFSNPGTRAATSHVDAL
jgi:hypothetical protein